MNKKISAFDRVKRNIAAAFANPVQRQADSRRDEDVFVERDRERPFVLAVFFTTVRMMIILVVLFGCACFGLVLGVAKAYVDTTPELDVSLLTKSDLTSYIYDRDGELITTFAGIEYRDWADASDIPDMLKNAVIAIEDVRFNRHSGVDYKRLFAAIVGSLSASSDAGGSTITQQLVKNKLLTSEVSYRRKIQEAYLALQVESVMEKDEILEAYLNNIYLGQSNYGVKAAADDYFGKSLSNLTIRECAMLAGMIQSPNTTDPRKNTYVRTYDNGENKMDITNNRTDTVINRMYSAGFISKEQRDAALADSVYINESSEHSVMSDMLYFVEYAVRDIVTNLIEQRGLLDTTANRTSIENELSRGGYSIYLSVDTDIQRAVQETLSTWEDYPALSDPSEAAAAVTNSDGSVTVQPQAAAVVIDQHTGELVAIVGGRDVPEVRKGWNRAYQSKMEVGSSIKPLAVYGPALDLGMSPASAIANIPEAIEGWDTETGYPNIGDSKYTGIITLRRAIVSSLNVAAARTLMEYVTPELAAKYLVNLGVDASSVNTTGSGLALGTIGISPIEMAAAYATIANSGVYLEPVSFLRVVDKDGRVVLSSGAVQSSREVFKPTTAYMLVDLLTDAVSRGTGTNAQIEGITVAGKTGTNSDYSSAYFAGMTGYYTAVVYVGHDYPSIKLESGSSGGRVAAPVWQAFMSRILTGRPDRLIIDASPVQTGLVQRTVCTVSGKLAGEACYLDATGHLPVTEWFDADNVPGEVCDMHLLLDTCNTTNQAASIYCPASTVTRASIVLIAKDSMLARYDPAIIAKYLPNAVFTDLTAQEYLGSLAGATCAVHTPSWAMPGGSGGGGGGLSGGNLTPTAEDITEEANALIAEVQQYLDAAQNLSETDRTTLSNGMAWLKFYLEASDMISATSYYEKLKYNYEVISAANPPAQSAPGA